MQMMFVILGNPVSFVKSFFPDLISAIRVAYEENEIERTKDIFDWKRPRTQPPRNGVTRRRTSLRG